jgi:hypothetical protein
MMSLEPSRISKKQETNARENRNKLMLTNHLKMWQKSSAVVYKDCFREGNNVLKVPNFPFLCV